MLMNTTFLGDSFSIKWQSRVITHTLRRAQAFVKGVDLVERNEKKYSASICFPALPLVPF